MILFEYMYTLNKLEMYLICHNIINNFFDNTTNNIKIDNNRNIPLNTEKENFIFSSDDEFDIKKFSIIKDNTNKVNKKKVYNFLERLQDVKSIFLFILIV